jgi:hypothetical protein
MTVDGASARVCDAPLDRTKPSTDGPFAFGRRVSVLISTGVVSQTPWISAAPALTYRLYAQELHLTHAATVEIFVVFPIGIVIILIGFGGSSDTPPAGRIAPRGAASLSSAFDLYGSCA